MSEKLSNSNSQYYDVVVPVPKTFSFLFYLKSIFVGLWVLIKWLLFYLWNNIKTKTSSTSSSNNNYYDYDGYHDKPPAVLVDNIIGRHSYVKLKGVKFHYVESGTYGNPLLLLLHGFPDCWLGWHNQILEFSRFFRVVAIDLKGFNDSEKPIWRQFYSPKNICEELRQFIFSLGSNTATIIGHDLGGLIGWYFAHTNPENVERFISVSAPHPNLIWDNLNSKAVMNNSWLQFVQLPLIPELDHSSSHSNFIEKCFKTDPVQNMINIKKSNDSDNTYKSSDIIDCYNYIFNRRSDYTGPLNYYRTFPFFRIKEQCTVRCPVLIVTGNEDQFCSLESMVKSTDYCNNPIVKIIEGASHWPQRQTPVEFNKVILNFLIGRRAKIESSPVIERSSSVLGRVFGAVKLSNVLDSVHNKTSSVISNALH